MYEKQREIRNLESDLYRKDLILTHGAGLDKNGNVPVHGKDRIGKAAELFLDGYSPKILMAGRNASKKYKEYIVREWDNIHENDVLIENQSYFTAMELIKAKKYHLKPNNWDSIYLVSNDWHGPRISNLLAPALLKGYNWKFKGVPDSRPDYIKEPQMKEEKPKKWIRDQLFLKIYKVGEKLNLLR